MTDRAPLPPLELTAVPGGTHLLLRVQPKARRSAILGVHAGALRVAVTAPPDKGRANLAVAALVAEALDLRASAVEVVAGHASRDKTAFVPLAPAAVRSRLRAGV